ncbi:Imidazolonepropionase [Muriicola jejuensis]|uniref:Amidohydrolase family protein n=1 Tax=Muriicola jejuensis TaxID=504488 RepID=A0A6P0UCF9_9FLAO|nr:amidohydrolase family protein [Muriicola jejuensis]NER10934.1 amidohydrolase family protein [Muriicola jejuensis]SMP15296.1 Imidazolonepropionase [Muriicola jejuensis]
MKINIFLLIALFALGCREPKPKSEKDFLIADVTLVDPSDGSLHDHSFVEIDAGLIIGITTSKPEDSSYKTVIDGRGMFLMPGLAEMHAHIPSPPASRESVEETLLLYLANGITTIRGMLGHPSHLELREQVESGEVLGPRIFTSSPSLNGNSVQTPEEAREKVTQYQKDGYDFLKIHPGIKREVFDVLVATARETGIPFAGHVPVDVGIRHALMSGYASIDHVDGFLEGLVPEDMNADPTANGFFGYNFTTLADPALIPSLVNLSREHKVWIVPTQSLFERWFAPVSAEALLAEPEMKYMPVTTLTNWKIRKEQSTAPATGFTKEGWEKFHSIRQQLIKALSDGGYGILLGSDAPQLFNVPGFSIHHEIRGMEAAGMSKQEILKSGTLNPALFFDEEDKFGRIADGLEADLILLRENPLQDLEALKKIEGVMVRGKWLDRKTLDKKLNVIATRAKER